MELEGKNIAVLGLARSGEAVSRLLSSKGAEITIFDSGDSQSVRTRAKVLREEGFKVLIGAEAVCASHYDEVVISPGIELCSSFVLQFSDLGIPVTGELEVAWRYCTKPVIAITGTNGKTTTTELISQMLNHVGIRTVACGNIGLTFSEVVATMQGELDYITIEVSSFQLETIATFHPHIAVWLNLTPDHLDRHPSMEDYRNAKLRIFENQTEDDFAIHNSRDALSSLVAKRLTFSAYERSADFTVCDGGITFAKQTLAPLDSFKLTGLHNAENVMAALAVGKVLEISFSKILPALQCYEPSPHRCELVTTINGVRYINDSKSTNVDSLAKALTLEARNIILIAGGKDKGFKFDSIQELVNTRVSVAILIGEMAEQISREWCDSTTCHIATTLQDAVQTAHSLAEPGDVVLFSPGTSSFDMFRDYADRGEQFRQAARNLINLSPIKS